MKKKFENYNYLLSLIFFQVELLKFILYLLETKYEIVKKFIKINPSKGSLNFAIHKKQLKKVILKKKSPDKFYDLKLNHLKDWFYDTTYNYSNYLLAEKLLKNNINIENTYFTQNNNNEKNFINLNYKKKFKEITKTKLPQKKKINKFLEKYIYKHSDNESDLDQSLILYKIPITYFSSDIFKNNYKKKNDLKFINLITEKKFLDTVYYHSKNYDSKHLLFNFNYSSKCFFQNSILLKKILHRIFEKNSCEHKIKNCNDTIYIIINSNIFLDKLYFFGIKKKFLKMIKFYENSFKYQTSNKQFMPYGDIHIFFSRNKII